MNTLQTIRFECLVRHIQSLKRLRAERLPVINAPRIALRQSGFNLLELMVVVSIIGILLVAALPAYAAYTTRAAASEAMNLAHGAETAVSESFQSAGMTPHNAAAAGYTQPSGTKYVTSVAVADGGIITVTFGNSAPTGLINTTLTFTPYVGTDGTTLMWSCGYAGLPVTGAVAPPGDGDTGNPGGATTTPPNYLPRACRVGG